MLNPHNNPATPGSRPASPRGLQALVAAAMVAALGCSGAAHQQDTASVSGSVTVDGEPISGGYLMILPANGRMARGEIDSEGNFVVGTYGDSDGAPVGSHPVVVLRPTPDEGPPADARPDAPKIPRRYSQASTSGLTVEIPPGGLKGWTLELTSK